jgi:plastocyanin
LEAFEARIDIVLQVGEAVHELNWNLINNSQQKVKVVGEIRRANGTIIARAESSGFVDPNGKIGSFSTTFITTPTQEEVMAFQWVWTIQTQTSQTIVCTFTKANPKSCVYTSTSTPTPTPIPAMGSTASVNVMNYSFSSKTVTISQGGTVTWNFNSGQTEHSTTRTGSESWDSGAQSSGSYSRTFNSIGTFPYVCKLHPSMTGTVVVITQAEYISRGY